QGHWPARQMIAQCVAFDQFAGYVMNRVILAYLINGQNIWMIESNHGARFLLKALQTLGVGSKLQGQQFERGLTTRYNVGSQIPSTHPAGADRFGNLVVANRLTDERMSLSIFNDLGRQTNS